MKGFLSGMVGQPRYTDGDRRLVREGSSGEKIMSISHGRYNENCSRRTLFGYGNFQSSAVHNSSFANTSGNALSVPIVGIWNPLGSGVMAAVLRSQIGTNLLTIGGTSPSPLAYYTNTNQNAITTGASPWNLNTLQQSGSQVKGFAATIALTGMVGKLSELFIIGSSIPVSSNAVNQMPCFNGDSVDRIDGAIIVMPGNVLAVLIVLQTVVSYAYSGTMIWEEIPL